MNYLHLYHAGNFADVFKHLVLITLLEAFFHKEKPFCYLDTHAGSGVYDLEAAAAQKTREYVSGIGHFWQQKNLPSQAQDYYRIIKTLNTTLNAAVADLDCPRFYPGSPYIARALLRPQDRMMLVELRPDEVSLLRNVFKQDKQVAIHHRDGYQALKALLPPAERRGLVLIDPPFEQPDEFETMFAALQIAVRRWQTGVFALWYPIKDQQLVKRFYHQLKHSEIQNILVLEFNRYAHLVADKLSACGMVIVNPPWQIDEQLKILLSWLAKVLGDQQAEASYHMEWLKNE